jgi:hypothetical protein
VEADGKVILGLRPFKEEVETIGHPCGGKHEAPVTKKISLVGELGPLDMAEGARKIVASGKSCIGVRF